MCLIKKICILALLLISLTTASYAEDDSRWEFAWSGMTLDGVYVDKETVELNSDGSLITFWVKEEDSWLGLRYAKRVVSLKNRDIYTAITVSEVKGKKRTYTPENIIKEYILPGSWNEKEVNIALKEVGKSPIYTTENHNWDWIYSSDTNNYTICTDIHMYMKDKDMILVFVNDNSIRPGNVDIQRAYFVDFYNHKICKFPATDHRSITWDEIVPESLEEAIYKAAKQWRY